MKTLNIFCFGPAHAEVEGYGQLSFQTEKSLELLIIAALVPDVVMTRPVAAAALRVDQPEDRARRALSTDLWRLRKAFSQFGLDSNDYLDVSRRGIGIRCDAAVSLDIRIFEECFDRLSAVPIPDLSVDEFAELVEIEAVARHDPLPDFDQEWSLLLRERLRSKYTALVDTLLRYEMRQDNWTSAIEWGRKLIEIDPMLEHAHRALMQCHFLTGNRGIAIRQYAQCAEILQRELGVAPSDETTRMYRGLLTVPVSRPQPAASVPHSVPSPTPLLGESDRKRPLTDQLSMALGNLSLARALVENVDSTLRRKT